MLEYLKINSKILLKAIFELIYKIVEIEERCFVDKRIFS